MKSHTAKISERVRVEVTKQINRVLGKLREDTTKQTMNRMKEMIKSREDTDRKLVGLKKEMQIMNDQHRKELEPIQKSQIGIQEIKNSVENIGSGSDH